MTTSNEIELILGQMQTLLAQTQVLAADVAKNYNNFTASPAFTGVPTAPTAPIGTNSDQLATTAYLDRLIGQPDGLATLGSDGLIPTSQLPPLAITQIFVVNSQAAMLALDAQPGDIAIRTDTNQTYILTAEPASTLANWTLLLFAAPVTSVFGRTGTVVAASGDYTVAQVTGAAPLASPTFTGTPVAPTPGTNINTTQIPTTAWVNTWYAAKASPTFTGTPVAPTAAVNTNTTQIATTAFVVGQAGTATPIVDGTAAVGTALRYAREDHVHPTDTSRAPLASPAFTGTPTAPTAVGGTNTTQIATTAFVTNAIGALTTGVSSVFGRSGAVTAQSGDYAVAQVTGAAPINNPTFTGVPAAPTPGSNISTTQIPTTAWVNTYFATLLSPTFSGQVGFNGGTVTASTPIINGNQTWNNAAVTFTGAVINITDTASAAASMLLDLQVGGSSRFYVSKNGGVLAAAWMQVGASSGFYIGNRGSLAASSDGVFLLRNNAGTDFGLLQFGGTTSSFPALKRNGNTLIARTADDTANVGFVASDFQANASGYFNFGATWGSLGYGVRDNAGTVEFKNSGGSWAAVGNASLASPAFTGTPTAPTAAPGTNTTQIATTAYVIAAISGAGAVASVFGRTGAVVATSGDYSVGQVTGAAPLASPTFTGTPAAPTAAVNTNTTQIATTAFVVGQAGTANPLMNGSVAVGTSLLYSRQDHVHPVDTSRAPLASPTFTGTPAAPTPGSNINTTQIPTTAWVNTYYAAKASPTFTGKVTTAASATGGAGFNMPHGTAPTSPVNGDLWTTTSGMFGRINGATVQFAPIDAPAFTGVPTAPTASPGTNTTQIATTAFVLANAASPVAGDGISVSGSTVSLNTNNSGGIGSYTTALPNATIVSGGTVAGGNLTVYTYSMTGGTNPSSAGTLSGVWRNVSGAVVQATTIGLFQRIS